MENDATLRALGRIKREADSPPLIITAERRENIKFFGWIVSGFISLIVTIVIATGTVISYKTDITQNTKDIASLKAETATAIALLKTKSDVTALLATENKAELDRRKQPMDHALEQVAIFENLKLPKVSELTIDMANQRDYGMSNRDWYIMKHGFAPPAPTNERSPAPRN